MGLDFIITISCLIGTILMGLSLAVYNVKERRKTHELRMQIYRERKRIKNEALREFLGVVPRQEEQRSRSPEFEGANRAPNQSMN